MTCALSSFRILSAEYSRLGLAPDRDSPPADNLAEVLEADYVVGQSRFTVDSLLEYGVDPSKIILQPLGVDTERFHPSSRQDHCRPFRVLFVGQLDIRKGLHHLLEAWASLRLPHAELVLVGKPLNQCGRELLDKYKGHYRWLGFVPHSEIPKLYQDSDIFVFPSLAEGSANVMYEAIASGLPSVVTTNSGSLVRDGIEGYLIRAGDVEAMKDRIRRLYVDGGLRNQMAVAARHQAERYTWQQFGRRLRLMYKHILSATSGSMDILDLSEQ